MWSLITCYVDSKRRLRNDFSLKLEAACVSYCWKRNIVCILIDSFQSGSRQKLSHSTVYLFKFEVVYRIRLCSVVKQKKTWQKICSGNCICALLLHLLGPQSSLVSVCLRKSALRLSDVTGCVSPTTTLLLLPSSQPCILQFCEWVTSHCHHCCSVPLGVSFPCRGGGREE